MATASATVDIPKEPAVRRAWVAFQLRIRGLSIGELARREGVSHQAVSQALMTPSAQLESAIARALGIPAARLFPERYDEAGRRIVPTRSPNRTTRRLGDQRQKRGAA